MREHLNSRRLLSKHVISITMDGVKRGMVIPYCDYVTYISVSYRLLYLPKLTCYNNFLFCDDDIFFNDFSQPIGSNKKKKKKERG